MTTRRHILLLIGVVMAWIPPRAWTQPVRLQKVGILSPGRQKDMACGSNKLGHNAGCFVEGLRSLGYGEGRNVAFEYRFAEDASERLPVLAAELVSLRPDVIFTFTTSGADAAAGATSTIPIVVGPAAEQTLERLAGNLARPVGNVTGFTLESLGQEEKCLQLLKELAPRTSRVAVLVNPDNPNTRRYTDALRPAASQLGLTLVRVEARNDSDLPQAFATIRASGADAIYMVDDAALAGTAEVRKRVIKWAMSSGLPVASSSSRVAPDGGLVSLGTDSSVLSRRAASYVHRILGGAKPGDLPVERPTTFRLSLNRKTAAALKLTIPQPLLQRADEVIQ
jgi:putative ABC transport system substrate-binding protein